MRSKKLERVIVIVLTVLFLNGCTVVFQKGRRSDIEKIQTLEDQLTELKDARVLLEKRLAKELEDKQVSVSMQDKGLVITFVAEVLFDSGKAKLREDSLEILDKVARILSEEVAENDIGIEGHTDNQPIKYSKWKSNWELSAHRALSVLHHIESRGVNPKRLSAVGYGEYKPVAPNDTSENRQLNRRVEIIIIPQGAAKTKTSGPSGLLAPAYEEELK